jgi:hypothetical protein
MEKLRKSLRLSERTAKALLTFLAALLIFGGPTYFMYILESLGVPHLLYLLLGLAFFTAGVGLLMHLFGKEGKS